MAVEKAQIEWNAIPEMPAAKLQNTTELSPDNGFCSFASSTTQF